MITIDIETHYSTRDKYSLKYMTTEAYVRDPRFEVIGVGVADSNEAPVWHSPASFREWAAGKSWDATLAHHAHFDGLILSHHFNIHPWFWYDTLSMARELHGVDVGGSLGKLAAHYEVGEKGHEVVNADGLRRADFAPDHLERYGLYCKNDVALTRALFTRMRPLVGEASLRGIDMMVRMFTDPVLRVDEPFLAEFRAWDEKRKQELLRNLLGAPDDETMRSYLMSNDKLARLLENLGVEPPTKPVGAKTKKALAAIAADQPIPRTWAFAKSDTAFQELLNYEGANEDTVRAIVETRLAVKSTINGTRAERLLAAGMRGPVPVYLKWFAAHTGRAGGGDRMNFQNFERVDPTGADPRKGSLRKSLIAPRGHVLVVVDSAQIEARVLAWLAGDEGLLAKFRGGGDFYSEFGSELFGITITKKTHPAERQIAKALALGLGYGMGWRKCASELLRGMLGTDPVQFGAAEVAQFGVNVGNFVDQHHADMASMQTRLSGRALERHCAVTCRHVGMYRALNWRISNLWRHMGFFLGAIEIGSGMITGPDNCLRGERHAIRLPDDSVLRYPDLAYDSEKCEYTYLGRHKMREKIYGGALTENVVQGLARAIVFGQALRIQDRIHPRGGRVVITVHDEVVFAVPEDAAQDALELGLEEMRTPPSWCRDLPLAAEGGYARSYGGAK